MKRRLLATLLSMCLLAGLLPTVALAENENDADTPQKGETSAQSTNIYTAEQFLALAYILAAGKVAPEAAPTIEQVTNMELLGFSVTDDAERYNEVFDQVQTTTLNFTGSFSLGEDFQGIGTPENPFKGSVYGNGHTITMSTDIENNDSGSGTSGNAAFGLFAYVDTSVSALTFDQIVTDGIVNMSGTCDYTAALIGYATGSNQLTVSNCTNNAEIITTAIKTGWGPYAAASGMVGYTTASLEMTDCANNGDISSQPNLSGQEMSIRYNAGASGLLTYASTVTMNNCVNSGAIFVDSSNERYAAGLICKMPNNSSEIIDCDNSGSIRVGNSVCPSAQGSKVYAGGIIALAEGDNLNRVIRECNNTGDIDVYSGRSNNDVNWNHHMVGGIGGAASAIYESCTNNGDILVEMRMGGSLCVGGIVGGQQNNYKINQCVNSGDVTTIYADTTKSSYSCVGGIIGLIYTLESTGCQNTGNISATVGDSISAVTYIGGAIGKTDHATGWSIVNFAADYEVSVTNDGSGIIGLGGVAGGPLTGKLDASTVNTYAEIKSEKAYVGGVSGYETSTYTTSLINSVISMDAALTSGSTSYLGGIVGQGRVSSTNSIVLLQSSGFETIRPYAGKLTSGQYGNQLSDYIVYSNNDFAEKETGDNTNGFPACAMLNGGTFLMDTEFEANTLAAPVKHANIFSGWYTSDDFQEGTQVTGSTAVPNKTYYAKWTESTCSLSDSSLEFDPISYGTASEAKAVSIQGGGSIRSVLSSNPNVFTAEIVEDQVFVSPADTLDAGTYHETIFITASDNATFFLPVSITISKASASIGISANPSALSGGGTVTLTVNKSGLPQNAAVSVSGYSGILDTGNGTYTVTLPNATADYTFTVQYQGDINHLPAGAECTVSVTQYTPPVMDNPPSSGSGYLVSLDGATDGGTVTVRPVRADQGELVTITVTPDPGYVLDSLTVQKANGTAVPLTKVSDSVYTFQMPDSRVTVSATFKAAPVHSFTDVKPADYYYDAVLWAAANGVTNGITATTFGPELAVSRAQMVTFLWRAHGSPKATGANPFTDVSTSDYYYDAVLWAVANGVTKGTSSTTFSPDAAVTRAQAVTFQWRAAGALAAAGSSFADVPADAYFANAVAWAVANGITNGTSSTTFSPDAVVTRAQAVAFLYRAAQ